MEEAAALLTMMSNPKRLSILCKLLAGEMNVMELSRKVNLSQSALSQHLAKLRAGRLVSTRREAQTIYYSVSSVKVKAVVEVLYDLYCNTDETSPVEQTTAK